MGEMIVFEYQGSEVVFDATSKMWNLNAMHQAAGSDPSKAPTEWLRQKQTQEYLAALAARLNMGQAHIYEENTRNSGIYEEDRTSGSQLVETRRGRRGGTWAHWQIAAAYAHYLRPDFYLQWNEWALERQQQIRNETAPARTDKAAERKDIHRQLSEIRTGMKAMWKRLDTLEGERQKRKALLTGAPAFPSATIIDTALDECFIIDPNSLDRMTSREVLAIMTNAGITFRSHEHGFFIALGRALHRRNIVRRRNAQGYFYVGIRPRVEVEA